MERFSFPGHSKGVQADNSTLYKSLHLNVSMCYCFGENCQFWFYYSLVDSSILKAVHYTTKVKIFCYWNQFLNIKTDLVLQGTHNLSCLCIPSCCSGMENEAYWEAVKWQHSRIFCRPFFVCAFTLVKLCSLNVIGKYCVVFKIVLLCFYLCIISYLQIFKKEKWCIFVVIGSIWFLNKDKLFFCGQYLLSGRVLREGRRRWGESTWEVASRG